MRSQLSNTVNHNAPRSRFNVALLAALAALAAVGFVPSTPALAADPSALESWRTLLPTQIGWTLLAGAVLVAVAFVAVTVARPRRDGPVVDLPPVAPSPPAAVRPIDDAAPAETAVAPAPPLPGPELVAAVEPPMPTPQPDASPDGSQLFLAIHHVDLSIDVLHRHVQREPRPMPAVWLMLLDLCRTHGREGAFRDIALEFHQRFNVRTPAWDGFPPNREDPGLEAYPRLVNEITRAWGTHDCRRLLDRLLYDNRGGDRRGFTLNAYNDLIALRRAADAVLDTIEQDLAEEAKVRIAFASASAEIGDPPADAAGSSSPLVHDLEAQLEDDLTTDAEPRSAIERERPALAKMLAREWGNAGMSARLCEMLARSGDGAQPLSKEAAEDVEVVRSLAQRLHAANGIEIADEPDSGSDAK